MSPLRDQVSDTLARPSVRAAIALTVVGVLFLILELQSPSALYWTGRPVSGTNSGGIVYYRVHGEQYTVTAPGAAPRHPLRVTVYVDKSDPSQALVSRPTRWIDAAAVGGWFVAAAACLLLPALVRRPSRTARSGRRGSRPEFDPNTFERYLERSRRPPPDT